MQCLKCDGALEAIKLDGVEVDKCEKCSGIWFDLGELDSFLDAGPIDTLKNEIKNNEEHDELKIKCPKCKGNGNMIRVASLKASGVHIDTCSVCYGQWLDGGELEELTNTSFINKIKSIFI